MIFSFFGGPAGTTTVGFIGYTIQCLIYLTYGFHLNAFLGACMCATVIGFEVMLVVCSTIIAHATTRVSHAEGRFRFLHCTVRDYVDSIVCHSLYLPDLKRSAKNTFAANKGYSFSCSFSLDTEGVSPTAESELTKQLMGIDDTTIDL